LTTNNEFDAVKDTAVNALVKAAAESPNVKAAGQELGKTALTLTKTINVFLLPLAALNFGIEKAKAYFTDDFQRELSKKTEGIPVDQLVAPKPSVVGPALQGLAFSHEESNLKDLYLNLIASAMDGRVADKAHPAFVEIIRQLTSEEAKLLEDLLVWKGGIPIAEIRFMLLPSQGFNVLLRHLVNNFDTETNTPFENPRMSAIIDNFNRLGLIEAKYSMWQNDPNSYSWVQMRPEYIRICNEKGTESNKVTFQRGLLKTTAFGEQFALAVGIKPLSMVEIAARNLSRMKK